MMTIEEMNEIREKLGLTYQKICIESGVPLGTVQKILGGFTRNPRVDTMRRLEDTLGWMNDAYEKYHEDAAEEYEPTTIVRDSSSAAASMRGGKGRDSSHVWTAAEREALPEYRRTELIDGVLYDMAAPTPAHQDVAMGICKQIDACITKHSMSCHAFMAPVDVAIDRDDYTRVQPDVFVVCDRGQITRKNIQGAPAYILEVLSPSTKSKDQVEKLAKYRNSGVQEYWMMDPDKRQVIVYDMRKDPDQEEANFDISLYGFHERVPLLISDGRCEIDMQPINDLLDELYG